jgi:hypothetical protein
MTIRLLDQVLLLLRLMLLLILMLLLLRLMLLRHVSQDACLILMTVTTMFIPRSLLVLLLRPLRLLLLPPWLRPFASDGS